MISGFMNTSLEAIIRLVVYGMDGQEREVEAIIDTGFTGFLTLPSTLIASLDLTWRGREQGVLGDGNIQVFDVYAATVIWDGQLRIVEVNAADTNPLVGMGLIYGHELRIRAVEGGAVTIEALP